MCPLAPISHLAEMDECWTDEGIFMSLLDFKNGSPLPLNVTSDVNPYQFKPSDLPDLWYFCSGVKTEEECGFWLETGEACEIFSNSSILGLRTTLQFHEGRPPNAQKTDWMMQEFRITDKCHNNPKDSRALCRVFLADEKRSPTIDLGLTMDSNVNINEHISKSQLLENNTNPDPFLENFPEMENVLRGDYLELNDLIEPLSRSSSSANSSCLTMTSEEYFDSMALLNGLQDDTIHQNTKDSNVNLNISVSVKSKEVVMRPATSAGSHRNGGELKTCNEGTSKERGGGTKKRKMMKYLCFMAF